ncbi:uncharacterized protein BDR25DRAFT_360508, partial [Lindgomyces ingoldianus]
KRKRILGEEHPDTISAMNNLAVTLGDQGKLDESIAMLKNVYREITMLLGNYHPLSKVVCANLTKRSLGRFAELYLQTPQESEEELCQQTLSDFEQTFGHQHPSNILLAKLIADVYKDQDQLDKEEQMYRRALKCSEDVFSLENLENSTHCDLVSSLGQLYLRRGKLADAEEVFRRELQRYEKAPGLEHTSLMDTIRDLYKVYVHRCITLRQEQGVQQRSALINLNDDIHARDMVSALTNLCKKFGTVWPSFLSLLGRMLIWTGKDDDAVIAFQHQFRLAESEPEQGGTVCDGCSRQLYAGMQRFVCKTCIDIDLCDDCYADYEKEGRETAENCQAHTFLTHGGIVSFVEVADSIKGATERTARNWSGDFVGVLMLSQGRLNSKDPLYFLAQGDTTKANSTEEGWFYQSRDKAGLEDVLAVLAASMTSILGYISTASPHITVSDLLLLHPRYSPPIVLLPGRLSASIISPQLARGKPLVSDPYVIWLSLSYIGLGSDGLGPIYLQLDWSTVISQSINTTYPHPSQNISSTNSINSISYQNSAGRKHDSSFCVELHLARSTFAHNSPNSYHLLLRYYTSFLIHILLIVSYPFHHDLIALNEREIERDNFIQGYQAPKMERPKEKKKRYRLNSPAHARRSEIISFHKHISI